MLHVHVHAHVHVQKKKDRVRESQSGDSTQERETSQTRDDVSHVTESETVTECRMTVAQRGCRETECPRSVSNGAQTIGVNGRAPL